MPSTKEKIIIVAAPSGSGKSTIVHAVMKELPQLSFSISATTRAPRGTEQNGIDYYFISVAEFEQRIAAQDFIEWEQVYPGKYYGTLKTEVQRMWALDKVPILDIDVLGALNVKKTYGDDVCAIFIQAPSIEELRKRLSVRATDTQQDIEERIAKAEYELSFAQQFDYVVVNDQLQDAVDQIKNIIQNFLK